MLTDTSDFTTLKIGETPKEKTDGEASSSADQNLAVPQQATPPADVVPTQATPPADVVPTQATSPADAVSRQATPPTTPIEHSTPAVQAEEPKKQDSSHSKSPSPGNGGESSSYSPSLSADSREEQASTMTTATSADLSTKCSGEPPTRPPLTSDPEVCLQDQKTDFAISEDSDQRPRLENETHDQRLRPENENETTEYSQWDSLEVAQGSSDSEPEEGHVDGVDGVGVEDDPRKVTTASAAPALSEKPSALPTASSASSPGTEDYLRTTPASTPETTQDSGFEEHGAGDQGSTDMAESTDEAMDSVSDTAAILDDQAIAPQDVTDPPAPDSPAEPVDSMPLTEVSGGGACFHDSSEGALATADTTETAEKQPAESSGCTAAESTRPEPQASTSSPTGTATSQERDDGATNRPTGFDEEATSSVPAAAERDQLTGFREAVATTSPERDEPEHEQRQSAAAALAGDTRLPSEGDAQRPDAGGAQPRDTEGRSTELSPGATALPEMTQSSSSAESQVTANGQDTAETSTPPARETGQPAVDLSAVTDRLLTSTAGSEERGADAASQRTADSTKPVTTDLELGAAAAAAPEQRDAVSTKGDHLPENPQETSSLEKGEIISNIPEADGKPSDGFRIGDRAAIGVPKETLVELQTQFGGVTDSMFRVSDVV